MQVPQQSDTVSLAQKKHKVLFVCLGNICRSPTAEAVLKHFIVAANLPIECDSAGTGSYHIGERPDRRAMQAAKVRGYDMSSLIARQVCLDDFFQYDLILAMDEKNLRNIEQIKPEDSPATLRLFLDYSEQSRYIEVPDPYYGGADGFSLVLDLIEEASHGLINHLQFEAFKACS